jgi:hypothetical protein
MVLLEFYTELRLVTVLNCHALQKYEQGIILMFDNASVRYKSTINS